MSALGEAFLDADFGWVSSLGGVWRDPPSHVEALQKDAAETIMGQFGRLHRLGVTNMIGQVVTGPAGSGKTHLIGTLRRRVWAEGGWFVMIDVVGITDFWRTAALGFIESLRQPMPNGREQYQAVFGAVLDRIPQDKRIAALSGADLGQGAVRPVNALVKILQSQHPQAMAHSNVIRALLLQGDPETAEIAYNWLLGLDVAPDERKALGLTGGPPVPEALVKGVCWLMSLAGPVMVAVDQIDPLVTAGNILAESDAEGDSEAEARARAIVHVLAGGLLDLHDQTTRAMTVITCLTETWDILRDKALRAATHRFVQTPIKLNSVHASPEALARLAADRLAPAFARHHVEPPYPTWPFRPSAMSGLEGSWPRQALMLLETYRQRFSEPKDVVECDNLAPQPRTDGSRDIDLTRIFQEYRARVSLQDILAGLDDGDLTGACLRKALELYTFQSELPENVDVSVASPGRGARPALHARLTFTFHDRQDLEKHYCFRVVEHTHHLSIHSRLRAAMTDSGIDRRLPFRHLFIIRNGPAPSGKKTEELLGKLAADGGRLVPLAEDDLRTFRALAAMQAGKVQGFDAWLRSAKPLCGTVFFRAVGLCPHPESPIEVPTSTGTAPSGTATDGSGAGRPLAPLNGDATATALRSTSGPFVARAVLSPEIPLGSRVEGGGEGRPASLPVPLLTRHTAIFAGSGSGKTVLLRRIVEEAALRGVPAIVLDTNNDLARLGQPWPSRPEAFSEADAAEAERYFASVEVVVWTPGVAGGRPLTLAMLPDFAAATVGEDRDQAVDMAWATLVPLVGASGATKVRKEGVLKEALTAFAARGEGGSVDRLIAFLDDLPSDVSGQRRAVSLAADMADQLRGRIAVNPLLNGKGQPLDPAVLFTADRPGRTRVSVINFSGLHADASRQDFVNQLQMSLFTFIRRHPSETPRLYVVDEAQNFAPSGAMTASRASATALAAQARKFGLGLIVATQAPRGIDTKIVSNCTTHLYGKMSSPALIDATAEMMAARGKAAHDLGTLTAGTFYYATEGMKAPARITTPLCLSHHPQNPAAPDEIIRLARSG